MPNNWINIMEKVPSTEQTPFANYQLYSEKHVDVESDEATVKHDSKLYNWLERSPKLKRILGVILCILSTLTVGYSVVIVKYLSNYSAMELTSFRVFIQAIICSITVIITKVELFPTFKDIEKILLLLSAGTATTCLYIFGYYSVHLLSLGDSSAILFSNPILVTILSCILLKERFTFFHILMVLAMSVSVILIANPDFLFNHSVDNRTSFDKRLLGLGSAAIACFSLTIEVLTLRKLKGVNINLIILVESGCGIFILMIVNFITKWDWKLPNSTLDCGLIATFTLLGFAGQLLLTAALNFEKASTISLVRCSELLLAYINDTVIFHLPPTLWSTVGGLLMFSTLTAISVRNLWASQSETTERQPES